MDTDADSTIKDMGFGPEWSFADLKQLHSLGVLQEANRFLFHPLGLHLVFAFDELGVLPSKVYILQTSKPEGALYTDLSGTVHRLNYEACKELRRRISACRIEVLQDQYQNKGHEYTRFLLPDNVIQPIGSRRTRVESVTDPDTAK